MPCRALPLRLTLPAPAFLAFPPACSLPCRAGGAGEAEGTGFAGKPIWVFVSCVRSCHWHAAALLPLLLQHAKRLESERATQQVQKGAFETAELLLQAQVRGLGCVCVYLCVCGRGGQHST
jgi:hypothetical protein